MGTRLHEQNNVSGHLTSQDPVAELEEEDVTRDSRVSLQQHVFTGLFTLSVYPPGCLQGLHKALHAFPTFPVRCRIF